MDSNPESAKNLLEFSVFKGLQADPTALSRLQQLMVMHSFEMREFIINETHNDSRVFFLLSGQVVIQKTDANGLIIVIGKADASTHPHFGESVLLGRTERNASVVAQTRCKCLSLSAKDFDQFISEFPAAAASIYRNLANLLHERLAKANQDLLIQGLMAKGH